jgi:crossover junction endodeoxyribonuclease RuvC
MLMIVLGIDPGTATTGYGVVKINGDNSMLAVEYGLIETSKDTGAGARLMKIYDELVLEVIKSHKPDVFVIEKLFFATNAKTAIRVGQAQGAMLLAAARYNLPVYEYSPMTIKKVLTGNGRADKGMVQKSVRKHLGAGVRKKKGEKTHFDNAADALAVAICHVLKEVR